MKLYDQFNFFLLSGLPFVRLPDHLSVCLSFCPCACPSVRLPVHLSICPFECPSVRLPVHLSFWVSFCPSACLSVRLPVLPSTGISQRQFKDEDYINLLFVNLSTFVRMFVHHITSWIFSVVLSVWIFKWQHIHCIHLTFPVSGAEE